MSNQFKFRRRVAFADTDMAGIMHFANVFRYMEETEHAFYRFLGIPIHTFESKKNIGWPRVHAECDYKRPVRFEDVLEIYLKIAEIKEKRIYYEFKICKIENNTNSEIAEGKMIVVCISFDQNEKTMKAIPIPPEIREMLATKRINPDFT